MTAPPLIARQVPPLAPAAALGLLAVSPVAIELLADPPEDWLGDFPGNPDLAKWQQRALCAQTDPDAFFPEKGGSTREAKRICSACEVRAECLEYALEHDERFGIWGGLSERERRRLTREAGED